MNEREKSIERQRSREERRSRETRVNERRKKSKEREDEDLQLRRVAIETKEKKVNKITKYLFHSQISIG